MDFSEINLKIKNIKRHDSIQHALHEKDAKENPFDQFVEWFNQALQLENHDPSAMVLATTDEQGRPDSRVVLLKELDDNKFIFFTNYNSTKAKQLLHNNMAALNFYWSSSVRQVRIRGKVNKTNQMKSESYFATRPRESQISVYASQQSSILSNAAEMDEKIKYFTEKFAGGSIPCPNYWGGYELIPFEYEFFQGRNWRIHDRLFYSLDNDKWKIVRLSP